MNTWWIEHPLGREEAMKRRKDLRRSEDGWGRYFFHQSEASIRPNPYARVRLATAPDPLASRRISLTLPPILVGPRTFSPVWPPSSPLVSLPRRGPPLPHLRFLCVRRSLV